MGNYPVHKNQSDAAHAAGEKAQQVSLPAIPGDPGPLPWIHMVANSHLDLCIPRASDSLLAPVHTCGAQTQMKAKHPYTESNNKKK